MTTKSGAGAQVAAEGLEVDAGGEILHLGVSHASADVTARHPEAPDPLVQHLGPVGQEAVEGDVLDARRVPEEPRYGVDAWVRARAQLRVREASEEAIDEPRVDFAIAGQEEVDGVQGLSQAATESAKAHSVHRVQMKIVCVSVNNVWPWPMHVLTPWRK